jgi:leader peptidase (prepilin peptidase) / N-methyltransferase
MIMTVISVLTLVLLGLFFLCWGSFLNVVACRLIASKSLLGRSQCPHCHTTLRWYQLIPVFSWFVLKGRCGFCSKPISWLYPAIELLTAIALTALFVTYDLTTFFAYFVFVSALIVTVRTDSEHLLIARIMSIGLIPAALAFQMLGILPLSFFEMAMGAVLGYGSLWTLKTIFWHIRKQEGIGGGDLELLAGIGSFVGPMGVLMTLLLGSILGSAVGGLALLTRPQTVGKLKLPFGAFMALAAITYLIFQQQLLELLFFA